MTSAEVSAPNPEISSSKSEISPNPRAALLAHLAGDMAAALAAGDTEAARIAHDALGRLMGAPVRAGDDVAGGVVVDLAAERTRRT